MPTSATDICITLSSTLHKAAGGWWVIEIPKGWIALTRVEVKAGLERGKALRRRLTFEARQTPEGDPGPPRVSRPRPWCGGWCSPWRTGGRTPAPGRSASKPWRMRPWTR